MADTLTRANLNGTPQPLSATERRQAEENLPRAVADSWLLRNARKVRSREEKWKLLDFMKQQITNGTSQEELFWVMREDYSLTKERVPAVPTRNPQRGTGAVGPV